MPDIQVIASPAERLALCQVVFQQGDFAVVLMNGAEGRAFRSFVQAMGLEPILAALKQHGKVSDELARDERPRFIHTLSTDAVQLYRQKLADLPRSALQELVVGELFASLHGVGPGPFNREHPLPHAPGAVPYAPGAEDWAPAVEVPVEAFDELRVRAKPLQDAMEAFQAETAGLDLPEQLTAALLRLEEVFLEETKRALERPGAVSAVMDAAEPAEGP